MLRQSELKKIADKIHNYASGFDAEVLIGSGDSALTRFSENVITQNVSGSNVGFSIRVVKNGKMGKASTGNLSDEGMKLCVETAKAALEVSEPDTEILPLVEPQEYQEKASYIKDTQEFSPGNRADFVIKAVEACKHEGFQAAGICSNSGECSALANSKGLWAYHKSSNASFSLSVMSENSSGWAEESDVDVNKIDMDKVIKKAIRIARDGQNPESIDPGKYTVILEPAAVADLILFLGWEAFNGLAFSEGRSCFSGKTGKQVAGSNITITDDFTHPLTPGTPFDFEGLPRQKVQIIENGIFRTPVHDRKSALKAGVEPTGHGMPQPDSFGPVPLNLIVSPGTSSLEEMIASTEKGLLVTRLHYCNLLNPTDMMLTGMTRDGLFMVENGKITKGLKNMRFTQSVLEILNNAEALSEKLYKTETFWGGGGTIVPCMKVNDFHFTSSTEN